MSVANKIQAMVDAAQATYPWQITPEVTATLLQMSQQQFKKVMAGEEDVRTEAQKARLDAILAFDPYKLRIHYAAANARCTRKRMLHEEAIVARKKAKLAKKKVKIKANKAAAKKKIKVKTRAKSLKEVATNTPRRDDVDQMAIKLTFPSGNVVDLVVPRSAAEDLFKRYV